MAKRIESHITMLYEIPPRAELDNVVRATPPLRLHAGAIERWISEPGIFVAVSDPHGDLRRFRMAALGTDDRGYQAHITLLHRESVTNLFEADEAWVALRDVRLNWDFAVKELVVYEEIAGGWRETGRGRFGPGLSEVARAPN